MINDWDSRGLYWYASYVKGSSLTKWIKFRISYFQLENTTFSVVLEGTGYSDDDDRSKPPKSKVTVKVWGIGEWRHSRNLSVLPVCGG